MKTWRKYARRVALGGLALDLVALEERHLRQMGNLQDRLDAETVYLRHAGYYSARDPQIDCMVRKPMEQGRTAPAIAIPPTSRCHRMPSAAPGSCQLPLLHKSASDFEAVPLTKPRLSAALSPEPLDLLPVGEPARAGRFRSNPGPPSGAQCPGRSPLFAAMFGHRTEGLPRSLRRSGSRCSVRSEEHTSELQSLRHLV